MKTLILGLIVVGLAWSANAVDKDQLTSRIESLTAQFTAMQQNADTRIPAQDLANAYGVVLLDRTKGAFIFGYHTGNGVAVVKDASGHWSAPAFVSSSGASLGAQIGGTKDFYVILVMSPYATEALKESVIDFNTKASATGGTSSVQTQLPTKSTMIYSSHNGLFAGAQLEGGSIKPDDDSNSIYYGQTVSMSGILFDRQVEQTTAGDQLVQKITEYSK